MNEFSREVFNQGKERGREDRNQGRSLTRVPSRHLSVHQPFLQFSHLSHSFLLLDRALKAITLPTYFFTVSYKALSTCKSTLFHLFLILLSATRSQEVALKETDIPLSPIHKSLHLKVLDSRNPALGLSKFSSAYLESRHLLPSVLWTLHREFSLPCVYLDLSPMVNLEN